MSISPETSRADVLPAETTSFIGRREEISSVRRRLSESRLVTLVGPAGVGKTRLALRAAAQLQRTIPDGVWLVELADVQDGSLVARTVATSLDLRIQSGITPLDAITEYLRDRRLVLILDNCEHVLTVAGGLADHLLTRAPHLRILATSRSPLDVHGEHILRVEPLASAPVDVTSPDEARAYDAVRLFEERARAADPGFELDTDAVPYVVELCAGLAGLPLAIELAAVKARSLPLDRIASALGKRPVLLSGGGPVAPDRQRTLRAALEWSLDLCTPAEQAMWGRLSVFAGGFDLRAAEHVCAYGEIPDTDVAALVSALADKSLLVRKGRHYVQLAPIQEYGREILEEFKEEEWARHRHVDWCRRMAAGADSEWLAPAQRQWVADLVTFRANVHAAIAYSLGEPGHEQMAMEIVSCLLNYWLPAIGSLGEAQGYLAQALASDRTPTVVRVRALWTAGWFALRAGDLAYAGRLLTECLTIADRLRDPTGTACATHFEGLGALFAGGRDAEAVALLEAAHDQYVALGDAAGVWMTLCHVTMAAAAAGDHEGADAYGRECLKLCDSYEALLSRSSALWALGYGTHRRGEQARATQLLTDGLALMRARGDRWGVAECLEVLAWCAAADRRHPERAARLLGAARAAWRAVGTEAPGLRPLAIAHDQYVMDVRERLGPARFGELVDAGSRDEIASAASTVSHYAPPQEDPREGLARLTPREGEVARLVARGMTNKSIAETLVIAQRTAEYHVENILSKLGFTSRTQIAAMVGKGSAELDFELMPIKQIRQSMRSCLPPLSLRKWRDRRCRSPRPPGRVRTLRISWPARR